MQAALHGDIGCMLSWVGGQIGALRVRLHHQRLGASPQSRPPGIPPFTWNRRRTAERRFPREGRLPPGHVVTDG